MAREQSVGTTDHAELIHQIVDSRAVEVEFQPVVDIEHDQVVGFEALSRGPEGSPLRAPDALFAAARAVGRAGELDWICRAVAFRQMLDGGLPPAISLFVNVAEDSLITECPEDLHPTIWEATSDLRVFIDLSGEAMARYPRQALETVRRARAAGWGVAIGDIEFSAAGMALLPLLEPDVVELSQQLLTHGRSDAGPILSAALGEAECTGAQLLVEGVEEESGARMGRILGGIYQRGWRYGHPGPLPAGLPQPRAPIRMHQPAPGPDFTPFTTAVEGGAHLSSGLTWGDVNILTVTLARSIARAPTPPVVVFVLPQDLPPDPDLTVLYRIMLARCPLILFIGPGATRYNSWKVRAAELPAGHRLRQEGCLIALSPTDALVVAARPMESDPDHLEIAISENSGLARELLRHTSELFDTLQGGIRHAAPI
ncbi:EAL domain-containing protein [Spirillospora albida]|uniref:EAL domain-containing protein n=1 Tax=Spirillospora albida TaxID=58123 RepID=UPI00068F7471|nr:EAL domain-containing protein [Spirillospora albida]